MKLEPFALERWMTTHELNVEFDITESGIAPLTVRELLNLIPEDRRESIVTELLDTPLGYSEAPGTYALRQGLASTYTNACADNILVTTGAIEANFLLMNVLLEAGDHVIAMHPAYQQLYSVPRGLGCDVDLWTFTSGEGYRFDVSELEALIRPETKLLVINTPHNPTGAVLSSDELDRIVALANDAGAWVLADEAYRWLDIPDGEPLPSTGWNRGDKVVTTGTFSKPFGLPGLRVGWMVAPPEIAEACWWMRDYVTLSPGKLNDRLALLALENREQVFERNREIVRANLETTRHWLKEFEDVVSWQPPQGGLLAMVGYQLDIRSNDLADRLATEYSVMLAPGAAFEMEYHLRLGLGQKPDVFRAGLERAGVCLHDLQAAGVERRT